jgi:hypothetical protein
MTSCSHCNMRLSTSSRALNFFSNQILYKNNIKYKLTLLKNDLIDNSQDNLSLIREIIRKKIVDVIDFVNARSKIIFDFKHKSFAFNIEDKVYLRLYHEYFLFEKSNLKLFNQRFDSYTIKRRIENVVYELNMSNTSKIHSIIFIAQLKSASDSNFYNQLKSTNSKLVKMKEDITIKKSYEMKRVLKKRLRKYEKITITQYLVK